MKLFKKSISTRRNSSERSSLPFAYDFDKVVFDLTEKIDEFIQNQAPLKAIIFDYYLNFIPYFANLYSSLSLFQ